jgi:hypothetical protein
MALTRLQTMAETREMSAFYLNEISHERVPFSNKGLFLQPQRLSARAAVAQRGERRMQRLVGQAYMTTHRREEGIVVRKDLPSQGSLRDLQSPLESKGNRRSQNTIYPISPV